MGYHLVSHGLAGQNNRINRGSKINTLNCDFANGGLPPFDAPLHIREDRTASDTSALTTFYLMDDGGTVFGK